MGRCMLCPPRLRENFAVITARSSVRAPARSGRRTGSSRRRRGRACTTTQGAGGRCLRSRRRRSVRAPAGGTPHRCAHRRTKPRTVRAAHDLASLCAFSALNRVPGLGDPAERDESKRPWAFQQNPHGQPPPLNHHLTPPLAAVPRAAAGLGSRCSGCRRRASRDGCRRPPDHCPTDKARLDHRRAPAGHRPCGRPSVTHPLERLPPVDGLLATPPTAVASRLARAAILDDGACASPLDCPSWGSIVPAPLKMNVKLPYRRTGIDPVRASV